MDITTTAQVIRALVLYRSQDPALDHIISEATTAMMAAVNSNSTITEQSLALIVAEIEEPTATTQISQWQGNIKAAQLSDGSWNDDVLTTSIALYALTASGGGLVTDQYQVVYIPDPALRAAINAVLGHNAGDAITIADLQQLTSLNLANLGVTNLTGLQFATNLTSLNTTGDNITTPEPPHKPPVANNDVAIIRGRRIPIAISPTANDTDPNGLPLMISSLSQPSYGQVVLLQDGVTVLYTPAPGFHGTDTFTYTITDGTGGFASATVTVKARRASFPTKYRAAVLQ
jgi:hypothetical protein